MQMEKTIFYVSDCCNAESNKDYEMCSQCGEHCTIIVDDSMAKALEEQENMTMEEYNDLPDYIPGLDDGEWGTEEDCCGEEDFA